MDFSTYKAAHAETLAGIAASVEWERWLGSDTAMAELRGELLTPPGHPLPQSVVPPQLEVLNGERVKALIARGERDEDALLRELSAWPTEWGEGDSPTITFLGLNLSMACNSDPRCVYCNQVWVEPTTPPAAWRRAMDSVSGGEPGKGPYVYISGGEPLLQADVLLGREGLIRRATERNADVNVNTNATLITPEAALGLVAAGTASLHVSLDTADRDTQDELAGTARFDSILAGIHNVQIARDALGVTHPIMHINCVMTRRNIFRFPELLRFLLDMKRLRSEGHEGPARGDALFRDLGVHLIPVGGEENAAMRPSRDEYERFFTETWARVCEVWEEHQSEIGTPEDERMGFSDYGFFTSPYHRPEHAGSLDDYVTGLAEGAHSALALCERCYVAPSQSYVLPDGSQYWCGAHTVSRPTPIGNINDSDVVGNIKDNIAALAPYPNEYCRNCAAATVYINQDIERALRKKVAEWLRDSSKEAATA
ncbi:MAG: radical SAM protein [Armatimonadota bacterium]|jgi:MoaA/NifB/PqqE/SkfB family radical SAM enzyme